MGADVTVAGAAGAFAAGAFALGGRAAFVVWAACASLSGLFFAGGFAASGFCPKLSVDCMRRGGYLVRRPSGG